MHFQTMLDLIIILLFYFTRTLLSECTVQKGSRKSWIGTFRLFKAVVKRLIEIATYQLNDKLKVFPFFLKDIVRSIDLIFFRIHLWKFENNTGIFERSNRTFELYNRIFEHTDVIFRHNDKFLKLNKRTFDLYHRIITEQHAVQPTIQICGCKTSS